MAATTPPVTSVPAGGMQRGWYATNAFALSLRRGERYFLVDGSVLKTTFNKNLLALLLYLL
jgi:hypothetical protein